MSWEFESYPRKSKLKTVLVLGVLFGIALIVFIYSSWWDNDLKITKAFGDLGFNNELITTIAGYFIQDGYFSLTTFIMPIIILLIESFALYLKKEFPHHKLSRYLWRMKRVYEVSLLLFWTGFIGYLSYYQMFRDRGFGTGFNPEYLLDWKFAIICAAIIIPQNIIISWVMGWYITKKLATKPDFLENDYWRRAIWFFCFIFFTYIVNGLFKMGFQRPLYLQYSWGDQLERIRITHPERWEIYMNQNDNHYYGYRDPGTSIGSGYINDAWQNLPGDWPWWKISHQGWFYQGFDPLPTGTMSADMAFPSGHLTTSLDIIAAICIYTCWKNPTKKSLQWRRAGFTIGISYTIIMFFSLGLVYGHWMSDMAFTFLWAPFAYFLANWTTNFVIERIFAWGDQKILPKIFKEERNCQLCKNQSN